MNYCSHCGKSVVLKIPEQDNRLRYVCESCNTIHYQNPKIVSGVLPVYQDQVLLCKRAIEPRLGLWTLPAGYMENGESIEEAAIREAYEEATINLEKIELYQIISLPHISQVYIMFLGTMNEKKSSAGEETLETAFFSESEIPWDEIAFPVIVKTLKTYYRDKKSRQYPFRNYVYHKKIK